MCVPVHCRLPGQQCRRDLLRQNQNQVQGHLHLLHQLRRRVSACLSINLRSALFPDFLAEADLISCIVCLARLSGRDLTGLLARRSALSVDGKQLVDNGGIHGNREQCGARELAAGLHTVTVTWFQAYGGENLMAYYRSSPPPCRIRPSCAR